VISGRPHLERRADAARHDALRTSAAASAGTEAGDAAVLRDVPALAPDQAAEFDRVLSMAPTAVRRGPPPVTPARGRRRTFLGVTDTEADAAGPAPRRAPVAVMVALTILGILVGSSLVTYMMWMRPMLRAKTVVPHVDGRRPTAPAPAPTPAVPPTVPTPLALDEMPADPIVQPESAPLPLAQSMVVSQGGRGAWAVQVGAFANAARARALRDDLSEHGFDSQEQASGDGALTVVLVGPYPSAEAAGEARTRLRQRPGFDRAIVRQLTARH
jgi:cell division septation protein DedD